MSMQTYTQTIANKIAAMVRQNSPQLAAYLNLVSSVTSQHEREIIFKLIKRG